MYIHTYTYIETSLLHATIINHQCVSTIFFFYQNIEYNAQTHILQSTKINQNNMI